MKSSEVRIAGDQSICWKRVQGFTKMLQKQVLFLNSIRKQTWYYCKKCKIRNVLCQLHTQHNYTNKGLIYIYIFCRILKMHLIFYSYVSCHDIRSFNSHFKKYVVKWSSRIFHLCSIKLNYTLVNPSKLKNLISDWEKMCYRKKGAWCGIIIILSTSFWNWSKKSEI